MAKEIVIYDVDGSVLLAAPLTKSSEWECKIMSSDQVTLSWLGVEQVTIPMGAYVINPINSLKYYSVEPYTPAMKDTAKYEYKPVFYHEIFTLNKIPFLLYTYNEDGNVETVESDWNFTGSGEDLALQLQHAIAEGIGTEYTIDIDESITASLSLSFSNVDILTAINDMADSWECEWWTSEQVDGAESDKIIHFGKLCQHFGTGTEALPLTAGQEIECPQSNNKATFYNRFYVFGGTNNIPQDYSGAQANHVVNKRLTLNPEKFPNGYIDLPQFDADGNALKDSDGNYIPDESLSTSRRYTKVLQFDDIYPKCNCRIKYGTLKSCQRYVRDDNDDLIKLSDGTYDEWYLYCFKLEYQDDSGAWQDFTINKSTYSETTNPNGSIIKGKTLSLHFNSGALEGREFEATYHDASKTFRSEDGSSTFTVDKGYFEVVHSEDNTIILPNVGIAPSEGNKDEHDGDKVVVFNIRMPESYYQTAYTELEQEAIEEIWDETKDSNEYTVKTNQVYFSKSNPHLTLGRRVVLWQGEKKSDTRVIGLKECLDRSFDASITFGKNIRTGTISTLLTEVSENAAKTKAVSVANETAIKMNKQQLYSAQREMYDSMFDTDGYFTAPISPVTVETAMLSVGATSTNFQLANITFYPNDTSTGSETAYNCFRVECGKGAKLVHYGLDYEATDPTEWTFSNQDLTEEVTDAEAVYYLYALCPKDGTEGIFELSTEQRKFDAMLDTTGEYCFLVGVLSSASEDDNGTCRVLNLSYGSTTVNGRFVRTGRIESVDGGTYFDLDTGEIGGNITFQANPANTETINNIIETSSAVSTAVSTAVTPAVTSAMANMEISGRNLLYGTKSPVLGGYRTDKKWRYYPPRASSIFSVITLAEAEEVTGTTTATQCPCRQISSVFKIAPTLSSGEVTGDRYIYQTPYADGIVGQKYILSAYLWANRTMQVMARPFSATGMWVTKTIEGGKWTRLVLDPQEYTGTSTSIGIGGIGMISQTFDAEEDGTYTAPILFIAAPKLEIGTVATAWTEAPEDVDGYIETAQTTATAAQTTANSALTIATTNSRNYLRGTSSPKLGTGTWATGTWIKGSTGCDLTAVTMSEIISTAGSCPITCVGGGLKLTPTALTMTIWGGFMQTATENNIYKGDTVLVSFYAWASRSMSIHYAPVYVDYSASATDVTISAGWTKITSKTYTLPCDITTNNPKELMSCYINKQTFDSSDSTTPVLIICGMKLEKGTVATPWSEAPEDTDYLKEALTEATSGTTEVLGGLVLSKLIAVKTDNNSLYAGMSGNTYAKTGELPVLWAGSTEASTDGLKGAAFRVYNDGQAIMSNAKILGGKSGSVGMIMNGGTITFGKLTGEEIAETDKLTEITSISYDTIQDTLNGMESADVQGSPTSTATISPTFSSANNQGGETCSADTTKTILTFTVDKNASEGKLTFTPSGTLNFSASSSLANSYKATYYNNALSATLSLIIRRNGSDVATIYSKTLTDSKNSSTTTAIAIAKASASVTNDAVDTTQKSCSFAPGDVFTLVAKMTYNSFIYTVPNHSLKHTTGTDAYKAVLNIGLSYTSKSPVYNNVYFSNGMFLSSASTQYFAVVPKDPIIFQARSSSALLKFGTNGLMQSLNGGSNYAAAAPRLYSVVWNSSQTSYTGYGRNCANATITRSSAGKLVLTHNLGSTKYLTFVQVKTKGTDNWYSFAKVVDQAANTVSIWLIDRDSSVRDDDCDVAIFPYA